MYTCVSFGRKFLGRNLSLKFVIPLYTYAVSHIYLFYFLSHYFPPWRKTGSWVMSNDFVIKCCSFVRHEWLSTLVNGSVPRDRYNHSWLTFCLRPAASSYYSSCQMLPKDSLIFIFSPIVLPMSAHMNTFLLQEPNVVWKTVETSHQLLRRLSPWIS